eukprot:maker-scaffold_18-snap-gene-2.64-mRNA-1 protein AED:0.00 eAED:0.00 QI:16/1/1/1/1/1/2/651/275
MEGILKRAQQTISYSFAALKDPHLGGDMVAKVGEFTGEYHLNKIYKNMSRHLTGSRLLREKPSLKLDAEKISQLSELPNCSFGRSVYDIMNCHGLTLGDRAPVENLEDPELAYVMQRYRETHDLLHIILGIPFSVSGEVALKWFEFKQTGLPMTFLASLFGQTKVEKTKSNPLFGESCYYNNYALQQGSNSDLFLNIYFEECWNMDMQELRKEMGVVPCTKFGLASLDGIWTGEETQRRALVQHYLTCLESLPNTGTEKEAKRRKLFETALEKLS